MSENPKNDDPKSAPPNDDNKYSFSKVWIPIGIAVTTLVLWCMSINSAIGDVRCKLDDVSKLDDQSGYVDACGNGLTNREVRNQFPRLPSS